MWLYEVIWKEQFVEKLEQKHQVTTEEVEQVLFSTPYVRRQQKGKVQGEDLYVAYGQTDAGRYLVVFFIYKHMAAALPISAHDMTPAERGDIMHDDKKQIDPIPDEFSSYEEAAEFWDTHDTTDYPDAFQTVEMQSEFRRRRYEIELDGDVIIVLKQLAQKKGVPISHLASELLRKQLVLAA